MHDIALLGSLEQKRRAVKSYLPRRLNSPLCGSIFVSLRILLGDMLAAPGKRGAPALSNNLLFKRAVASDQPRARPKENDLYSDAAAARRVFPLFVPFCESVPFLRAALLF